MAADPTPTASATASATATSSPSAEATEAATDGATADATEAVDDAAADAEEQPVAAEGFVPEHEGWPNATKHSQQAYSPTDDFTAKWTRADAMQIQRLSNPDAASGESSLPEYLTMPEISNGFPATNSDKVWVWDTWTLTDDHANQISYNGWEIIFSLVADRDAGYVMSDGVDYKPQDPHIVQSEGRIHADENGVWLTGFRVQHDLLTPDGKYYQSRYQNQGGFKGWSQHCEDRRGCRWLRIRVGVGSGGRLVRFVR